LIVAVVSLRGATGLNQHSHGRSALARNRPTECATSPLIDRVMMICGAHFPFPSAGVFTKDGDAYAFTPVVQS